MSTNEIVIYQSENLSTHIDVLIEDETVWLTQLQMAELFQTTRNNVTLHIGNIFKEHELEAISVSKDYLHTASDGKKTKLCVTPETPPNSALIPRERSEEPTETH